MARRNATPKKTDPAIDPSIKKNEGKPAQGEVTTPSGTQRLGKGLWGIVGSKTHYGTVTQFSGLEYVRYEYRRIPEEFRDAAFKNDYLDVIDITEDLPAEEETSELSLVNELVEPGAGEPEAGNDQDPAAGESIDESSKG